MISKKGPQTLLTIAEEEVLMQHAHPVTKRNVLQAVTRILADEVQSGIVRQYPPSFNGSEPKRKWWRLFRNRHPTLTFRKPETLTSSCQNLSKATIKQWFFEMLANIFLKMIVYIQ
jgi:hypothetical protein